MKVAWSTKINNIVLATDYEQDVHGMVRCIDEKCRVNVIHNKGNDDISPHFKTTGYAESQHKQECGFFHKLDPMETLEKMNEYKAILASSQVVEDEYVIDLNLGRIDPDRTYLSDDAEEQKPTKKKDKEEEEIGEDKKIIRCSSPKAIVKLLLRYTPDELTNIFFSVKRGATKKKIPLSELIITPDVAYRYVTENNDTGEYFVLGKIKHLNRREKVIYISLYPVNGIDFTLVVFQRHFPYFTYTDEQLKDKHCVIYGKLRKNTHRENLAEIVIKSNDYIAPFRKRRKESATVRETKGKG